MAKAKEPVAGVERRRLNWKDVTTIIVAVTVLSGMLMSIVGWIHAEVTIPKILHQTSEQIREALEVHSKNPHPVSASRREFEMLKKGIEDSMDDFKTDSRDRLTRIEAKVDRL